MYQKVTLDNGLRVITANMPHTRSVCVSLFMGVGSRYETSAEAGVSHFIEHLLFRGTEKRPTSRSISEAIEGVGGILNGGTDKELTVYWCKVAQTHFPLALDVLSDMLLNSKFDPQDMEKERQIIIEEINRSRDYPPQWVDMLIDEILWPGHPLGRDTAGTQESITAITREAMLNFLAREYQPGNTVIAVAGNIQHQETVEAVNQALGKWVPQSSPPGYLTYEGRMTQRLRIEPRDLEQVHLCLALPGVSIFDPRHFILDLLDVILGAGMSSRLFTEVRDKLGLAYDIHSYVDHFLDCGSVVVSAGVKPQNLATAIKAILEQLRQLKESIPEAELTKAKEQSKGNLLLRMEDSHNVASWLGDQEFLTKRIL